MEYLWPAEDGAMTATELRRWRPRLPSAAAEECRVERRSYVKGRHSQSIQKREMNRRQLWPCSTRGKLNS